MRVHDPNHVGLAPILGGSLFYEKMGSGPPLVLLHPAFSDSRFWDPQMESLSQHYSVIRYDQRGAGRSSMPTDPFSHVEDLNRLLRYLGISEAHFMGHAIGAQIALDLTLTHPGTTTALILVAPVLSGFAWSDLFLDWIKNVYSDFTAAGISERILTAPFLSRSMKNTLVARRLRLLTKHNVERLLMWKCNELSWPKPEAIDRLSQVNVPLCLMVGTEDSDDFQKIARRMAENVKDSRLVMIEEADHCPNLLDAKKFNANVLKFFAGTAGRQKTADISQPE
jgi:3-oxoadipate enol-lactonase